MKRLGITQRVMPFPDYNERRDCLDQRWLSLAYELGFIPIPLPNITPTAAPELLDALQLDAVILSGGNSIASLDPAAPDAAPERDAFEATLIDEMLQRSIPVLGVCRGMQMINVHLGGQLSPVAGHAGSTHRLLIEPEYANLIPDSVNSFHDWTIGPGQHSPLFTPIARDHAGNIEGFEHKTKSIAGIMWHPERESPFKQQDIHLLKKFLL